MQQEYMSDEYKVAIKAPQRTIRAALTIALKEDWIGINGEAVASSQLDTDHEPDQAKDGRIRPSTHISDNWAPIYGPKLGWKSAGISDEDGVLATPEYLQINYFGVTSAHNVWMIATDESYPVDFTIEVKDFPSDVWTTIATVTGNNNWMYNVNNANEFLLTGARLTVTKMFPANAPLHIIEFGIVGYLILEQDDMASISVLQEASADSTKPFGNVSSNELTVELTNEHRWWTPANVDSPFHSLLKQRLRMQVYLGIELAENHYEFTSMGEFYSETWSAPSATVAATVVANDKFYATCLKPVPSIRAIPNASIGQLIEALMFSIGYNTWDIIVDSTLYTKYVSFGWIPAGTVREALELLAEAGNFTVSETIDNRVIFKPLVLSGDALVTWTDDDMLLDTEHLQAYNETYHKVTVQVYYPVIGEETEVSTISQHAFSPGDTIIEDAEIQEAPVLEVTQIRLKNAQLSTLRDVGYGANTIFVGAYNGGDSTEYLDVVVMGTPITTTSKPYTTQIASPPSVPKVLEVDNPLIQDMATATSYAAELLQYVSNPLACFKLYTRGDMAACVWDIIEFRDLPSKLGTHKASIVRQTLYYDGTLSAIVDVREVPEVG